MKQLFINNCTHTQYTCKPKALLYNHSITFREHSNLLYNVYIYLLHILIYPNLQAKD